MTLTIRVTGTPGPQGSHRGFVVNGRAIVTHDSAKTRPWRQDVKTAALDALGDRAPLTGPVSLRVCFYMPRPKAHYNAAGNVKPYSPHAVSKRPDIDKLLRSTIDALTEAGVFRDDAQIAHLVARKCYTSGAPGAFIEVERCASTPPPSPRGPTPTAAPGAPSPSTGAKASPTTANPATSPPHPAGPSAKPAPRSEPPP